MNTPRFLRTMPSAKRAALVVGTLLMLGSPLLGQPLEPSTQIGDSFYFLDNSTVRRVQGDKVEALHDHQLPAEPKKLLQPDGWADSFLLVGEKSVSIIQGDAPKSLYASDKDTLEVFPWGSRAVVYEKGSEWVRIISAGGTIQKVDLPGLSGRPIPLGSEKLLAFTREREYALLESEHPETPRTYSHPFSEEELEVTTSGGRALLWSKSSDQIVVAGEKELPRLDLPPASGVKPLGRGEFLLVRPGRAIYLSSFLTLRQLNSPAIATPENFGSSYFFPQDGAIQFLFFDKQSGLISMSIRLDGGVSGGILGREQVRSLVLPSVGEPGRPFLITETILEEDKVHKSGESVVDLKTGQPATHSVKGHTLYTLDTNGKWRVLKHDERARLAGPAQIIGGKLVYATQSEPPHLAGTKRKVDGRYPYPKVVLHGLNAESGTLTWDLDLERGDAPSAARLPESKWPTLGERGPILLTTEDNRLFALDVATGKLNWVSQKLPMDESRPTMFSWGDRIGLVATDKTTRKLLLLDPEQGKLLASVPINQFFNSQRTLNLLGVVVICLALIVYIYLARKKDLFIRRIAGLEALDEAVGRATEMGKPVLYVTGLADVDDIQTLASLSILSHVAKKTAEYDTSILATTSRAVTFSAAQEVVRDAFTIAGRPDSFSVESVQYISDDQFGYAAGVDGMMVREKPAANFYMGKFYAESLIFAETGYATGAIQIAGTAQANQLPFFVAACDYTLIGEELFAASAYLSGDPLQVGSLRGQDVGKAIVMILLVLASIDATLLALFDTSVFQSVLGGLLK